MWRARRCATTTRAASPAAIAAASRSSPRTEADRTLDLVAEAKVAIVTLPTVNLYLQDRGSGRTPRWRGVTLVHEMRRRGIVVAAAGDNCRDCFYAYGDHDMVDTFRQAVRILHLDHPLAEAPVLVGPAPAAIARLSDHGHLRKARRRG